jgi:hypothetical protein
MWRNRKHYFIMEQVFISLMTKEIGIFSYAHWPFICFLWRNVYSNLIYFLIRSYFFFCRAVRVLYILDISPLSDTVFAKIFSHSVGCMFVCVGVTGVWTQGIHLESLHQPFFVMGFFKIGSRELFVQGWHRILIFLISASWVARIIGMSHQCPASFCSLDGAFCSTSLLFNYLLFSSVAYAFSIRCKERFA